MRRGGGGQPVHTRVMFFCCGGKQGGKYWEWWLNKCFSEGLGSDMTLWLITRCRVRSALQTHHSGSWVRMSGLSSLSINTVSSTGNVSKFATNCSEPIWEWKCSTPLTKHCTSKCLSRHTQLCVCEAVSTSTFSSHLITVGCFQRPPTYATLSVDKENIYPSNFLSACGAKCAYTMPTASIFNFNAVDFRTWCHLLRSLKTTLRSCQSLQAENNKQTYQDVTCKHIPLESKFNLCHI